MQWLNSWESFVKTVEAGSMAAAARRLDCTRAQISKQIADLERAFGVRLFERSTRKLSLTPSGEIFHQHALRALDAIHSTEVAVRNMGEAPYGVLRISASITFGRLYIAPLLPKIVAKYPDLNCELVLTDHLVDLVEENIDLALRLTNAPPDDAVARRLVHMKRVICATPAYFAAHGEPRTPLDLVDHPCFSFLMANENRIWRLLDQRGEEFRVPVNNKFHFNNADCIMDAVLAGHGLGMLPTYLCGPELASGRLVTTLNDYEPVSSIARYLYACYTPNRVRVPKVRVFLDELEQLFKPVPPWELPETT
jgi:DNA-binding transcriptional LysR family regulator